MLKAEGLASNSTVVIAVKSGFIAGEVDAGEPVALQTAYHDYNGPRE